MTSPISRDYARRPELIGDLGHVQWMKRPTFSAINRIREQKHSEFKKPYREDDHVPMEHWADYPFPVYTFPPFPNFPGPVPGPDSPWVLHPGEKEEEEIDTGCPPTCYCHPDNPQTIIAGGDPVLLSVTACAPPNEMTVTIHEDNYFKIRTPPSFMWGSGAQWVFSIAAEADACGLCTLIISCSDGSGTICYLRCDNGVWVTKSETCQMKGKHGTPTALGGGFTEWEYVEGYKRQYHISQHRLTSNTNNCDVVDCVGTYCSEPPGIECEHCTDWDTTYEDFQVPCINRPTDLLPNRSSCYTNANYLYQEWECP